jgi:hypothetical protein
MEGSDTFIAECFWPAVSGADLETDEQRQTARSGRGR